MIYNKYICININHMEIYKLIDGYDNYEVSNYGNIRLAKDSKRKKAGFVLKPVEKKSKSNYIYYYVSLNTPLDSKYSNFKAYYIHRLVAMAFIPNPMQYPEINHIDGNIHNNSVNNLEWVTALENNLHSINNVRKPQFVDTEIVLPSRGDYKDRGKGRELTFSEEEAVQYCEYMLKGYRGCDLRVMMNISPKTFTSFRFHREHKYKYIADRYDFSHLRSPKSKLEDAVVKEVCKRLQEGEKVMSIYQSMDLSRTTVRGIKDRRSYKHISENFVW